MNKLIIKFESSEWDEIQKRIIGKNRKKQSSYFLKLFNLKLKQNGVKCALKRRYFELKFFNF